MRPTYAYCWLAAILVGANGTSAASDHRPFASSPKGGTITGRVTLDGPAPSLKPLKIYKHRKYCGAEVPDESLLVHRDGGIRNVVVTIEERQPEHGSPREPKEIVLDNIGCRFVPHVQAAQVGTTVLLLNSDPILHDAHARMGHHTIFNEGLPTWRRVQKSLLREGIVKIICELHHAWMSAYIVVTSNPYFTVTNEKGEFAINGLPQGTHVVSFWHERLGRLRTRITVEENKTTAIDVSFRVSGDR